MRGLMSDQECDEMVELSRGRLARSLVNNQHTGGNDIHEARTSEGAFFQRGENPLAPRADSIH